MTGLRLGRPGCVAAAKCELGLGVSEQSQGASQACYLGPSPKVSIAREGKTNT